MIQKATENFDFIESIFQALIDNFTDAWQERKYNCRD